MIIYSHEHSNSFSNPIVTTVHVGVNSLPGIIIEALVQFRQPIRVINMDINSN